MNRILPALCLAAMPAHAHDPDYVTIDSVNLGLADAYYEVNIGNTDAGWIIRCAGYDADGKVVETGLARSNSLATQVIIEKHGDRIETFACVLD